MVVLIPCDRKQPSLLQFNFLFRSSRLQMFWMICALKKLENTCILENTILENTCIGASPPVNASVVDIFLFLLKLIYLVIWVSRITTCPVQTIILSIKF